MLGRTNVTLLHARLEGGLHQQRKIPTFSVAADLLIAVCVASLLTRVDPFGIYRLQAEVFGGRSDGKFVGPSAEVWLFQALISAGYN
jgi:hypothetical protein